MGPHAFSKFFILETWSGGSRGSVCGMSCGAGGGGRLLTSLISTSSVAQGCLASTGCGFLGTAGGCLGAGGGAGRDTGAWI